MQAIVRMSGTVPRSIHLDLEGWWNSRSASDRVAGEAAIRQYFYDEWTAPRPELGIGITHLARDLKSIHALSTVDFAIPQIYASVGNYGRPINKRLVRNDFLRAAEALGSGKRIVVGQTANDDYVTPTIMREMLDLIMRISHPHVGGVREVAFWSDLLLLSNTSIRRYFERLTTVLRMSGLDITNLPTP